MSYKKMKALLILAEKQDLNIETIAEFAKFSKSQKIL